MLSRHFNIDHIYFNLPEAILNHELDFDWAWHGENMNLKHLTDINLKFWPHKGELFSLRHFFVANI